MQLDPAQCKVQSNCDKWVCGGALDSSLQFQDSQKATGFRFTKIKAAEGLWAISTLWITLQTQRNGQLRVNRWIHKIS